MAIKLRQNETIKAEAHFHWSAYIVTGLWAAFLSLGLLGTLISNKEDSPIIMMAIIAYGPIFYTWLKNKSKSYVVTNERLYVEDGIISKTKTDIPLNKINDISFSQGILQRIFNSGNLLVMTGNNKPTVLFGIDNPENFREILSQNSNAKAAN